MSTASGLPSESKKPLSADAAEFVPVNSPDAVIATQNAVMSLLNNPEAFFEVANPLVERLSTLISDSEILEAVMEHIFQQSIFQVNFHYTGARLCSIITQKLNPNCGDFRKLLLKRCQAEYSKREELSQNKEGLQKLCGFALFFAELMLNLKIEGLLGIFTPKMIDLLSLLLSIPNEETIKCVNKILKLTGTSLESSDSKTMNEVYEKIKAVIVKDETSEELRRILLNLVTLRSQNFQADGQATEVQNGIADLPEPEFRDESGQICYEDYAGETEYDYGEYGAYPVDDTAVYGDAAGYDPTAVYVPSTEHDATAAYGATTEHDTTAVQVQDGSTPEYDVNDAEIARDYEAWVSEDGNSYEDDNVPDEMDSEMHDAYEQFLAQINQTSISSKK